MRQGIQDVIDSSILRCTHLFYFRPCVRGGLGARADCIQDAAVPPCSKTYHAIAVRSLGRLLESPIRRAEPAETRAFVLADQTNLGAEVP